MQSLIKPHDPARLCLPLGFVWIGGEEAYGVKDYRGLRRQRFIKIFECEGYRGKKILDGLTSR